MSRRASGGRTFSSEYTFQSLGLVPLVNRKVSMCLLAIKHCVDITKSLPRDRWQHRVSYGVELSWGEVVSGDGYDDLERSFKKVFKELDQESLLTDTERLRSLAKLKVSEIGELLSTYLAPISDFALDYETKSDLIMDEVLAAAGAGLGTADHSESETLEIHIKFVLRERRSKM